MNGRIAAASASFFENDEHDILDCEWRENRGLRQILFPLLDNDTLRIRREVVKTNLAFRRSATAARIQVERAIDESEPFLAEIVGVVVPKLVLLTGPALALFTDRFASKVHSVVAPEKDPGVRQTVFAAARVTLRATKTQALVVQVAHASQFSWTYGKYSVVQRINSLIEA